MSKLLPFILLISLILSCSKSSDLPPKEQKIDEKFPISVVDGRGLSKISAVIKTVHGNVTFKFYSQKAPHTVTRLVTLINQGFYDGLTFHKVIPNYIIQTGDPSGTGNGGSGVKLKAEFNDIQHIEGTVAMARDHSNPDSADSQFYIALSRLPHLDAKYTVIGQVVEGLNNLYKITSQDKIISLTIKDVSKDAP